MIDFIYLFTCVNFAVKNAGILGFVAFITGDGGSRDRFIKLKRIKRIKRKNVGAKVKNKLLY